MCCCILWCRCLFICTTIIFKKNITVTCTYIPRLDHVQNHIKVTVKIVLIFVWCRIDGPTVLIHLVVLSPAKPCSHNKMYGWHKHCQVEEAEHLFCDFRVSKEVLFYKKVKNIYRLHYSSYFHIGEDWPVPTVLWPWEVAR